VHRPDADPAHEDPVLVEKLRATSFFTLKKFRSFFLLRAPVRTGTEILHWKQGDRGPMLWS
jgi:hypothetical protein